MMNDGVDGMISSFAAATGDASPPRQLKAILHLSTLPVVDV